MDVRRSLPVLAIVGPTAAGKTGLSMEVAEHLGAEIVNLDAMQVFRGLDIGTAKPDVELRARVPHHLFDIRPPDHALGAGSYAALAQDVIQDIHDRSKIPILVGGTGFYLRVLRDGLAPLPEIPPELRSRLRERKDKDGLAVLRAELEAVDPAWAARVHPNDSQRTIRGLEVYEQTGIALSEHLEAPRVGALSAEVAPFLIQPTPEELRLRIEARAQSMLEQGWIAEVEALLLQGVDRDVHGFRASGYREILAHLDGEYDLDELLVRIIRSHKSYARRQRTFFRKEPGLTKVSSLDDLLPHLGDSVRGS